MSANRSTIHVMKCRRAWILYNIVYNVGFIVIYSVLVFI